MQCMWCIRLWCWLFSGAAKDYSPYPESEFKEFIAKLSSDLIRNGFRIVNGYGLGIGNEVVAGAVQELKDMHKPVDGNLIVRPFPQGIADSPDLRKAYREEMISLAGVSLFFMGNKEDAGVIIRSPGVRSDYDNSIKHGNLLVRVGMTR